MTVYNRASCLLMGAVVGTFSLVPAHGSAQNTRSGACADVVRSSPLATLTRCAEQGVARAQFFLAINYANGDRVPENDAEAVRWYRLAAEQGHASSQHNLGLMYARGEGVAQDDAAALDWFRRSAAQGNQYAQFSLGVMYNVGRGVPENDAEAARWFRLASEQLHPEAQYNLALMYLNGDGVPRDRVLALMWCTLAASQGHEGALARKESFEQGMTRAQITEGHERALAWVRAAR